MDTREVLAARERRYVIEGLLKLDRRPQPNLVAERGRIDAALKDEMDVRLKALREQEPAIRTTLKPVGRLKPGTLTQAAVGFVLRKLMDRWETPEGRTPNQLGYSLFESDRESALDMVGADFVLVAQTGNFMLVDATCSHEKGAGTGEIPLMRQQGTITLLEFPRWVDNFGIDDALFQLEQELKRRMPKLLGWAEGSPLHLLDVQLPVGCLVGVVKDELERVRTEEDGLHLFHEWSLARQALETFVVDLEGLAQRSHEPNMTLLQQFAAYLRRDPVDPGLTFGPLPFLDKSLRRLSDMIKAAQRPKKPSGPPPFRPKRDRRRQPPKR
jgi:hypothetical protein